MRDALFVLLFLPMLVPAVRFVHVATMLWAWTALAGPTVYLFGFAAAIPYNKVAVAATILSFFLDKSKKKMYFDTHMVILTLFMLQGVISFMLGVADIDRTYDTLDKMVKIWILCVVMTVASRGRLQIHAMVVVICLAMGIHGILESLKYISSAGGHVVTSPATIGDNNYLALASLMVTPLMIYLSQYSAVRPMRLGFLGAALLSCVGVVATASRGGLIGLVVLGLQVVARSRRKIYAVPVVLALAAGVVMFAPAKWTERMDTIKTAKSDESFMSRVASWKMNLLQALDRPLVGAGYSGSEDPKVFMLYLREFSAHDFIETEVPDHPLAAHSIYFQVIGDLGFPGFFLFMAMLLTAFRNVRRIRQLARGDPTLVWARDLGAAFGIILIVYMVAGAALSAAYFELLYIILTLISVLRRHLEETAVPRAAVAGPPLRARLPATVG